MTTALAIPGMPAASGKSDAPSGAEASVPAQRELQRFSVAEYHRLIREGFFAPGEQCELIRGFIVRKTSRDPIHDAILEIVLELLRTRIPAGWRVRPQMAVTAPDSEPEPDAAVVKGRPQDYFSKHPVPAETALAVEVAYSSLASDRSIKGPLYAENGIPAYWIVNIPDRRVEVYTQPSGQDADPGYRRREDYLEGMLISLEIAGIAVAPLAVTELLPPN